MAGRSPKTEHVILSFPPSGERASLLAFQFGDDGKAEFVADFTSEKEKLALLHYAEIVIRKLNWELEQSTATDSQNVA